MSQSPCVVNKRLVPGESIDSSLASQLPPRPAFPTVQDLLDLFDWMTDEWAANHDFELPPSQFAYAVLARWGNRQGSLDSSPPADGEVVELVAEIRHFLAGYQQMRGLDPEHIYSIHRGDKMEAHITVSRLTRAAELLQRQALVPVAVSERPWQPIDTAPRDGTEILASDYDAIDIVSWEYPPEEPPGWVNREDQFMFPAWWQPLPDHPELPEVGE